MASSSQFVRVRLDKLTACLTCRICNQVFEEATTISECLHTFCRKCITDKITDEELECCPVCEIDLGCAPLEKLRPDHNLQSVRSKVFPPRTSEVKAPEVMKHLSSEDEQDLKEPEVVPSVTVPARRKERSLSSLVTSTPRVSTQATMAGRRTKGTRKVSSQRSSSISIEKPLIKEKDSVEDSSDSSISPDNSNMSTQSTEESLSPHDASQSAPNKETDNETESWEAKSDLWKPLNYLVEVASRSKSFKSNMQGCDAKLAPAQVKDSDSQVQKSKVKDNKQKEKVADEKTGTDHVSSDTAKPKKSRKNRRKKEAVSGESGIPPQAVVDPNSAKLKQRTGPIWFSLVASDDQEGDAPLPQISSAYIKIKDGNIPVSFIQKYLVKKLDLTSEAEVEVKCLGQPVVTTLLLNDLIDLWLQTASPKQRIPATIGGSAKDCVMVLTYARKAPPP